MVLNQLKKTTVRSKKRVGRGYGSGKGGHTAGRGAKGQKARSKVPLYFEGTAMRKSLIRRLPMLRGKLRFKSLKPKPIIFNLKHLNLLPKNSTVDNQSLIKHGLLPKEAKNYPVKILGDGELKHPLKIALAVSKSAAKKITQAGGKVVKPKPKQEVKPKKPVKPKKKPTSQPVKKKPAKKTTKKTTKKATKKPAKKTIKRTAKKTTKKTTAKKKPKKTK
jgi:large subunit ribosomal protein L15